MTDRWITAPRVFDGESVLVNASLRLVDGKVAEVAPGQRGEAVSGMIAPGFYDIQVNGGGGVLLNTQPTVDGITTILAAHRQFGTVGLLPTVISDRPEVTEAAAEACLAARDLPGMMGIHIEGPHLSIARRGTHQADVIRDMDGRTITLVRGLRDAGLVVLITVAPETTTPAQVRELAEMGAFVSIGHSDGTFADARELLGAGAVCFTHLFNAMSPMLNRAPGITGAAIASDAYASVIADGIHVDPVMVALACRARPVADRMIAVSDAMATVGGPARFTLYGQEIHLSDGRLINAEGSLAGAHLTVADAVRNLVNYGIPLQDALRMGRRNPAAMLGLPAALIGTRGVDLIVLDDDLRVTRVGLENSV